MSAVGQPGMIVMVRVWMEGPNQDQFRARITRSTDNMNSEEPLSASSAVDQVLRDLRDSLEAFCSDSAVLGGSQDAVPEASAGPDGPAGDVRQGLDGPRSSADDTPPIRSVLPP